MLNVALPTSKSLVWDLLRKSYANLDYEEWSKIPNKITGSLWLAEQYASRIKSIATTKKVVVLEWGCGLGSFAYRLLQCAGSSISHYVLCDLQNNMPSVLSNHPQMKEYYLSGKVSFYVSDFEKIDSTLDLILERFNEEDHVFVMIFNYVLDALPTDVWFANDNKVNSASMVMRADGHKSWLHRKIDEITFSLEIGDNWHPSEPWYEFLLSHMSGISGLGAIYNVPVSAIKGFLIAKRRLKNCLVLVCDIPLHRKGCNDVVSPYFVDGMLAGVVDFEMLALAMQNLGASVWTSAHVPGVELAMSSYVWGDFVVDMTELMSISTFWLMMQNIRRSSGPWGFAEALSYLDFSRYDTWLLSCCVDNAVGTDITSENSRVLLLSVLKKIEKNIYWIHGDMDYLHLATLYRWQKDYESSYQSLIKYASLGGYDHPYWYCIGYWYYDQCRYYDAIDAWNRACENDDYFSQLLNEDLKEANLKLKK